MRRLFEQMVLRPLEAFVTSVELLARGPGGSRTIDGILSRMVHTLSRPHVGRSPRASESAARGRAGERRPLE